MVNQQKPTKPKVTTEEKKYRENLFSDVKEIKTKNILCTSCGTSVKDLIAKGKPISHPFMETLLCKKCSKFYGDGQFSEDEDGCDKYCRWCGQGGTLYLCSSCTAGFCKKCVKRNLPKSALLELEKDDWDCYCCNPTPLFELRAQCWAAEQYATEYVNKSSSTSSKNKSAKSAKKKRTRNSSSDEEEVSKEVKKTRSEKLVESSDENQEEKKSSDLDEIKSSKISAESKNEKGKKENGDEEEKPRRTSLRGKKSGKIEDEMINGLKIIHWNQAIKVFDNVASDIAKLTKEMHKKILEYKIKKINVKHINTDKSFEEVQRRFEEILVALSDTSLDIKKSMNKNCEDWKKEAASEREKANKTEDSNQLNSTYSVENGIANDSSEGNNKADELSSKISEAKDSEETEDNNTGISVDSEKDSNKSIKEINEEEMEVDSFASDTRETSVGKDCPLKENGDSLIKEPINKSENKLLDSPGENKSEPKEDPPKGETQVSEEHLPKSNEISEDSSLKSSSISNETVLTSSEKNDSDQR